MKRLLLLTLLPLFVYLQAAPPAFLEAQDAFNASMIQEDNKLKVKVVLADNIYLYKEKVKLSSDNQTSLQFDLPDGEVHDGFDGPENIFTKELYFEAKIASQELLKKDVTITLEYQGCSAAGLCYQPMSLNKTFTFNFTKSTASTEKMAEDLSEGDRIKAIFDGSFFLILLTFFGLGVLLSLTPCIFPMIPILSSIIVSQGENITTKRSFLLSVVYVLAMAVAYTIAGILSAKSGDSIQAALQTPWVLVSFSLVFVALSLSMFGFYDLELPKWMQTRVSKMSKNAEGKGMFGVAIMGFLSALIVGPCVAAPLAGVLAYIGQTGDAILGGSALFVMSIGMGLPLLVIGLGAGKLMPKPGGWMENIKVIFGVAMLAVAIWMLKRVMDESSIMLLIAFLAIISSLYLGALDSHYIDTVGWHRFYKGLGVLLLLYGLVMFVGSFTKGSISEPLRAFSSKSTGVYQSKVSGLVFTHSVSSIAELDKVLQEAGSRIVMLDFTASWCAQCEELEEEVFKDAKVVEATEGFVLVHADISVDTKQTKALKRKLEVQGPPALRFFKNKQEISRASRMQGPDLETFLKRVPKL